jgi:hypothetical protein
MQTSEQLDQLPNDLAIARTTGPNQGKVAQFPAVIDAIAEAHRPSDMPFFQRLGSVSESVARDPKLLGELYLVYQAAMHATRAAVYHMPHLDNPAMRKRKLQIFIDDDGLPGGDTHHYQLTRAFQNIGADCPIGDEDFGDADELVGHLDGATAKFVRLAKSLYARSLGPWCIVETMSDDWMRALADGLSKHFPAIIKEPYFADCFSQGVEERHAEEAIAVTQMVLEKRPSLLGQTIEDARAMADALDGVWVAMDEILSKAIRRHETAHAPV